MGLWSPECDLRFLTAPARVSRSGARLPRIFKDLAVPRSLVKLLKGLDMRKLARSHSTTELLPLCVFDYKQPRKSRQCAQGHTCGLTSRPRLLHRIIGFGR